MSGRTLEQIDAQISLWHDAGLRSFDSISAWLPFTVKSVTSAYTIEPFVRVILVDATAGPFTVTLPSAVGKKGQQPLTVKRMNAAANVVTVGSVSGTIDGGVTTTLNTQYQAITVVSDGSQWVII